MLVDIEKRECPGCRKSAVNEAGGLVVAFGQSFFHVDCFKCAKCNNTVTADTNLLLLSDGSPICADCSYNCNVCHQPILDEAIMTGDDSYHAHCFKCKVCHNRIDELVFAKTSHGIYCMNCHNDRMAKIRRHAQRKREKERAARDRDLVPCLRARSSAPGLRDAPSSQSLHVQVSSRSPTPTLSSSHSQSFVMTVAPPTDPPDALRAAVQLQSAPANLSFHLSPDHDAAALSVPTHTSRADKRHSINPLQFKSPPNSAPCDMARSQTFSALDSNDALSRRSSNASSIRDNSSDSTIYLSPSSSPAMPEEQARPRSVSHDPQSASRPPIALDRPPKRSDSLRRVNGAENGRVPPKKPPRLEPSNSERSSPLGWNGDRIIIPTSPSHPTDVPHGVESGTDTEADSPHDTKSEDGASTPSDSPPLPPPKPRPGPLNLNVDLDMSHLDASNESSPVERTSIATFIAPALPPIRFSMSGADFSDFLRSVGGIPSLKSLDEIAQLDDAPPKSPTSIHTLIPQDHLHQPPTDVPGVSHGDSSTSSASVAPIDDTKAMDTAPNLTRPFPSRAFESQGPPSLDVKRERLDSDSSLNLAPSITRITVTSPTGNSVQSPVTTESHDLVLLRLQEALADANARGSQQLRFEKQFVQSILMSLEQIRKDNAELKGRYDKTKRASDEYMDGLTVAQKEYDRELVARRNAESEIIRLRVLLSGQVAKLTALTGETSRREARQQLSEELSKNLDQLEKDLSKLKAERDVTLAEVEELCSSKNAPANISTGQVSTTQLSRSLTMRLDSIKKQYQHELVPLTQQRETLIREITELKSAREQFLEETTVLNARNEELAQLSAQYTRRMEVARSDTPPVADVPPMKPTPILHEKKSTSLDRNRRSPEPPLPVQPSLSPGSNPSTSTLVDERDVKIIRVPVKSDLNDPSSNLKQGKFKWPGHRVKDHTLAASDPRNKNNFEHHFQPASALRFTRCDHCGEKLWGGAHFRCATCHINVHSRCVNQVHLACSQHPSRPREDLVQPLPSMFGRDLVDQVRSDLRWGERKVPVIVEKCIDAVETLALDFEGIYRKTGGSSQTKMITHLFDQGDYTAFDLTDTDRFNDICSVTSVLKTYFRSLPVPLLTYDLHEEFIAAAGMKDPALKTKHLQELVNRLPSEHYYTLRALVLHLHRVREHCDMNLMNARNLGVVFGPTLMWSRDPNSEFSDMAGKALMVEWLVESAPTLFST